MQSKVVARTSRRVRSLEQRITQLEEAVGHMQKMTLQAPAKVPDTRYASAMELAEELICL